MLILSVRIIYFRMGDSQLLSPHANRSVRWFHQVQQHIHRMQNVVVHVVINLVYTLSELCFYTYLRFLSSLKISYQQNNRWKAQEVSPPVRTMTIRRSKRNQGGNGRISRHINCKNWKHSLLGIDIRIFQ